MRATYYLFCFTVFLLVVFATVLCAFHTDGETFEEGERPCKPAPLWDVHDVTLHWNDTRLVEEYHLLNDLTARTNRLVAHLRQTQPRDARTAKLCSQWKGKIERLSPEHTTEAAVTVDKSRISICLRDKSTGQLHGANVAMFVLVHELAHIVNASVGHGSDFWNNMRWLLFHAERCGVYKDEGFEQRPVTFCGHSITGSPLTCVKSRTCSFT